MTKEVAVKEEAGVAVIGADEFDLGENMEGVEAQLPRIKIFHQGQMFGFPDDSKKQSFSGVIIDMSRTNAYWAESFDLFGGGDPPTCFSLDGVNPEMSSAEVQTDTGGCARCPRNQFGSNGKRGKMCKNMKRVHILVEGSMMPFRLTVPPSNLKAVDLYVSLLTSQGVPYQLVETEFSLRAVSVPYQLVETEFSLRAVKNKDGIEYSELNLNNVGPAPMVKTQEDAQKLKALIVQWRGVMRGEVVTGEEM
jgi:hypothetical protein